MKLWTVTVSYAPIEILAHGLKRYFETTLVPSEYVVLDHLYPKVDPLEITGLVENSFSLHLMRPYKNMGGHEGFNWVVKNLPVEDDDLIIGYDPDSNPLTKGWDEAMLEAMRSHRSLGSISLMHTAIKDKPWIVSDDKPRVALLGRPEMFNVTMWRVSALKATGGLLADRKLYGMVETAMYRKFTEMGLYSGYLYDYEEGPCPVAHDPMYVKWKEAHAFFGFEGSFEEFLESVPHTP